MPNKIQHQIVQWYSMHFRWHFPLSESLQGNALNHSVQSYPSDWLTHLVSFLFHLKHKSNEIMFTNEMKKLRFTDASVFDGQRGCLFVGFQMDFEGSIHIFILSLLFAGRLNGVSEFFQCIACIRYQFAYKHFILRVQWTCDNVEQHSCFSLEFMLIDLSIGRLLRAGWTKTASLNQQTWLRCYASTPYNNNPKPFFLNKLLTKSISKWFTDHSFVWIVIVHFALAISWSPNIFGDFVLTNWRLANSLPFLSSKRLIDSKNKLVLF